MRLRRRHRAGPIIDSSLQIMCNRLIARVGKHAQTLLRTAFFVLVREAGDLSRGIFAACMGRTRRGLATLVRLQEGTAPVVLPVTETKSSTYCSDTPAGTLPRPHTVNLEGAVQST